MHQYPRNDKDKDLIWEAFLQEAQPPQPPAGRNWPRKLGQGPYPPGHSGSDVPDVRRLPPQTSGSVGNPAVNPGAPGQPVRTPDPAQELGHGAQGQPQSGALEFDNEPRYQTALDALQQQHGQFLATSNRQAYANMIADHPGVSLPGANRNQAISDITNWLVANHPNIPESTQPSIDSEMLSEDAKDWALLQDEEDPDYLEPDELVTDDAGNMWVVIQHDPETNKVNVQQGSPDPDSPHSGIGDTRDPGGTLETLTFDRTELRRLDDYTDPGGNLGLDRNPGPAERLRRRGGHGGGMPPSP
jgi:hypothetical protein